jgi:hypothetical protein
MRTAKGDPERGVFTNVLGTPLEGSAMPEFRANNAVICNSYSPASAAK